MNQYYEFKIKIPNLKKKTKQTEKKTYKNGFNSFWLNFCCDVFKRKYIVR